MTKEGEPMRGASSLRMLGLLEVMAPGSAGRRNQFSLGLREMP